MPENLNPAESRILGFVTDVWQPAATIAAFANRSTCVVSRHLNTLLEKGKVEREWDGNLGVHYWRLKRDLRFHRALEEI
jgi:predicted transcriptional regulator